MPVRESLTARRTLVALHTTMHRLHVRFQMRRREVGLLAESALERPLPGVMEFVQLEGVVVHERLVAEVAGIEPEFAVNGALVEVHGVRTRAGFPALRARGRGR